MSRRRGGNRLCTCVLSSALAIAWGVVAAGAAEDGKAGNDKRARLRAELRKLPYRIVYESYRGDNWDLFMMNADGSGAVNLTRTPEAHDLYPHASPDGGRICFVVDEGSGEAKSRNVYTMGVDGGGRTLIARNARQPCWGPDGRSLAYLPGEFDRFTYKDYATKGLVVYDVKTGRHRPHPNGEIHHLYNLCWSPDGKWFTATVHGGMGHKHANLAFPADGKEVFKLPGVGGCRPDISPDGKRISWNASDHLIAVADVDFGASGPIVTDIRKAITCDKEHEVYHSDWSPDGKYIAFSYGPKGGEQVGTMAKGWHICVADAAERDVWIALTTEGVSNKEPDWVPAGPSAPAAGGEALSEKQLRLAAGLKKLPYRIVYETYRKDNWELFLMSADGSGATNITNTPDAHELYPHASPDGTRISFVADEGRGTSKARNVYIIDADGTGRTLVARNARQPCWGPDGRRLLYAKGEYERFTYSSYGTKGLFFYDTASRRHTPHPNESLLHVTYLCWSPAGGWILGTVHGGMGYDHANLAVEATGTGALALKRVGGCRMDVSPDGSRILWNASDRAIVVADLDPRARPPGISNVRTAVSCGEEHMVYHGDFSPDGKYLLFSHGPNGPQHVGLKAPGWHVCVADAADTNVWVALTTDGQSNKEPDWVPAASRASGQ